MRNKRTFDKVQHLFVVKPLEGNFLNLTKSYASILYNEEIWYIAFKTRLKSKTRMHAAYGYLT